MATKRNYYESGGEGGGIGGNRPSACTNFLTTESYVAEYVVLRGWRQGTFTSVTAYLYAVDGSNKPTGSALATSQTISGDSIPLDPTITNVTFTFGTSYTVENDTQYAIVVTVIGGNQGDHDWFDWFIDNSGGYRRGVYIEGDDWYMYSGKSLWFQVWGSDPPRQIDTPTPSDTATGIVLVPLLQWKIDGASETVDGDLFDIYLKAGDSDFGEGDLLQADRTSLSIQILYGLSYNTLYYWKVLAASTAGDLLDSAIWTFTTMLFLPPAVSGGATPTGVNNMVTIKRLVVASNNKIWYET